MFALFCRTRICVLSPQSTHSLKPLIVIPARMASTRLPGKPLADIGGQPMIVHVWRRACEAQLGPVVVACADPDIARVIEQHGGRAVLTDPNLPSGSDRAWHAVQEFDPHAVYTHILNVQGDLPTVAPHMIADTLRPCIMRLLTLRPWPPKSKTKRTVIIPTLSKWSQACSQHPALSRVRCTSPEIRRLTDLARSGITSACMPTEDRLWRSL